jgi:hypothetical protein
VVSLFSLFSATVAILGDCLGSSRLSATGASSALSSSALMRLSVLVGGRRPAPHCNFDVKGKVDPM